MRDDHLNLCNNIDYNHYRYLTPAKMNDGKEPSSEKEEERVLVEARDTVGNPQSASDNDEEEKIVVVASDHTGNPPTIDEW